MSRAPPAPAPELSKNHRDGRAAKKIEIVKPIYGSRFIFPQYQKD